MSEKDSGNGIRGEKNCQHSRKRPTRCSGMYTNYFSLSNQDATSAKSYHAVCCISAAVVNVLARQKIST